MQWKKVLPVVRSHIYSIVNSWPTGLLAYNRCAQSEWAPFRVSHAARSFASLANIMSEVILPKWFSLFHSLNSPCFISFIKFPLLAHFGPLCTEETCLRKRSLEGSSHGNRLLNWVAFFLKWHLIEISDVANALKMQSWRRNR